MAKAHHSASKLVRQVAPIVRQNLGLGRAADQAPAPGGPLDLDRWARSTLGVYWLGHASVLVRVGGVTVLTDPHFQETSGPRIGGRPVGRRRSTALPMTIDELPPIDVIALSHAHMDHWEKRSLHRLARPETAVVIPRRTRGLLPGRGRAFGEIAEVHWGQSVTVHGLEFGAVRPRHWGARWAFDWWRGFNAYTIAGASRRILFAGDTGETDAFDGIGPIDLAILGIGNSYEPWARHHMNPEQAAAMAERMGASLVAPVHHATFHDPSEGRDEPLDRLRRVWPQDRIVCARVGEAHYEVDADGA